MIEFIKRILPLIMVSFLFLESSLVMALESVPICPLVQIKLSKSDILDLNFKQLEDSKKFKKYSMIYLNKGITPLEALTKGRIDFSEKFTNPDLGSPVTHIRKGKPETGLSSFYNFRLTEKSEKANVCKQLGKHWYKGGYVANDYDALEDLISKKKEIWQEKLDDCVLSRINNIKTDLVLTRLVTTCSRNANKKSGYHFY